MCKEQISSSDSVQVPLLTFNSSGFVKSLYKQFNLEKNNDIKIHFFFSHCFSEVE